MLRILVDVGDLEPFWKYQGGIRGIGGVRDVLGGSRYSGTRRVIGGIRGHWGTPKGCRGLF